MIQIKSSEAWEIPTEPPYDLKIGGRALSFEEA